MDAALRAGVKVVNISAPMSRLQMRVKLKSEPHEVAERVTRVIGYAREKGLEVALGGEDSSRADLRDVALIAGAAAKLGVFRFRFADTLGLLDPFSTYEYIRQLREVTDLPVEFHGHNDLGLATANTLAAMRAGRQPRQRHRAGPRRARRQRPAGGSLRRPAAHGRRAHRRRSDPAGSRWPDWSPMRRAIPFRVQSRLSAPISSPMNRASTSRACCPTCGPIRVSIPPCSGRRHKVVIGKHSGLAAVRAICARRRARPGRRRRRGRAGAGQIHRQADQVPGARRARSPTGARGNGATKSDRSTTICNSRSSNERGLFCRLERQSSQSPTIRAAAISCDVDLPARYVAVLSKNGALIHEATLYKTRSETSTRRGSRPNSCPARILGPAPKDGF